MKKFAGLMLAFVMVAALVVPMFGQAQAQDGDTILDIAQTATVEVNGETEGFGTLALAVELAGLAETLSDPEAELTVFAPVDSGFAAIPPLVQDYVLSDTELLATLLTYHVVPGKVMAADLEDGMMVETVQGDTLMIHMDDMGVRVNGANVVATDIEASNGVVHVIDAVVFPTIELPEVSPADSSGEIITAGSSTVGPLSIVVANQWEADGAVDVPSVDIIGSGAGFERFCESAETDISNASRGIKAEEVEACQSNGRDPLEFRVGTDAIAVTVSVENDFVTELTVDELSMIFTGEAVNWSDVNPEWPEEAIQKFIPGEDSGTFDFFVEEIADEQSELVLNAPNTQPNEDDNVLVEGIANDQYAIGFFGYAYYVQNRDTLRILSLDGVTPNDSTVENGSYVLARPLFIYSTAEIMQEKPQVAAFINYYLSIVNDVIEEVGYFPPSSDALNASKVIWLAATGE